MDESRGTEGPPETRDGSRSRRIYTAPAIAWDEAWEGHANLMAACAQKDVAQPGCETEPTS